ncbi:MAG: SDR family oxidoreductase [Rhodobiaceae bacterium]|nr:SDR family oxidoreductase [Rhodobiaceae bacterium]MCC0055995.1 SDR family oxidoreductase [Rhodobiaceae bacterium]
MGRLAGKRAVITGAGAGIGRCAAEVFAREGARVAILEIDHNSGNDAANAIVAAGGSAIFIPTDVTDGENVQNAIEEAQQAFGGLDVIYNNAGLSTARDGPVTRCPDEEFWSAVSLNLYGTWACCRYGIPALIEAGGGSIINTVSIAAMKGLKGLDAFTAAKGGVVSLTRSMAVEFAPDKIRVNAIAPTMIMTERVRRLSDRQVSRDTEAQNLLGPGEPIEIAHLAVYLASDESRITTGQIIPVDSGVLVA